jgi:uncharacterized cupredoxin-like copper-binding protein
MRIILFALTLALLSAVFAAGCGDNDESTVSAEDTAATTQATTDALPESLTIRMSEYAFDPNDAVAKAGTVTIAAPNDGKIVHELVVLDTDADPAKLPMDGDEVDESTAVGELADVEPGATKTDTFELAPGKYAMVCALPGHYEEGMYGSLTVK